MRAIRFASLLPGLLAAGCEQSPTSTAELGKCVPLPELPNPIPNQLQFSNPHGGHATYSTDNGQFIDTDNPFFQSLGTNGRSCATCHSLESGLGLSVAEVQRKFEESCGLHPLFRTVDGANNPGADVSTLEARRAAYSMLLDFGVIRIQIPLPDVRDFDLIAVDDPQGNSLVEGLSVFRRPLMATNLKFIASIMLDSREPTLGAQAINATLRHAEAAAPPSAQDVDAIVAFETSLFTSQVLAIPVGSTSASGAAGDPVHLSTAPFFVDMNRPPLAERVLPDGCTLGTPGCVVFALKVVDKNVIRIYDAWKNSNVPARAAIARGQDVFNFHLMPNPDTNAPNTCSTCHNAFDSGGSTHNTVEAPAGAMKSVHISDEVFRVPGTPLYTFQQRGTGAIKKSTDPGRAFVSGKFVDISGFKMPGMRGLAARAPYFHNGMAPTLEAVVDHYNVLFRANFTAQQRSDLIAFMQAL